MAREKNKIPSKTPTSKQENSQEKEFESPEATMMLLITGISDIGDLFGLLVLPIPIIGQVIFFMAKIFSLLVWAVIQLWLIFKGVNRSGSKMSKMVKKPSNLIKFIFSGGSLLDLGGVPFGQTISLAATIYLANHPKIAGVAESAVGAALTGGSSLAVEAGAAGGATAMKAGVGETLKRTGRSAGEVAARTGKDMAKETLGDMGVGGMQEDQEDRRLNEALGEEPDVFEKLERLTSESPDMEKDNFEGMSAKEKRRKRREEFVDIAGMNAEEDEEERRRAA